jgi:hypothetical protein
MALLCVMGHFFRSPNHGRATNPMLEDYAVLSFLKPIQTDRQVVSSV